MVRAYLYFPQYKEKHEDCTKFKTSLLYKAHSRAARATQENPLSKHLKITLIIYYSRNNVLAMYYKRRCRATTRSTEHQYLHR